jgi:hypothetical protein
MGDQRWFFALFKSAGQKDHGIANAPAAVGI